MTREEKVQYWLDIADYDLDTAEAMHQTGALAICGLYVPSSHRKDAQSLLVRHTTVRPTLYPQP